MYDYNCIGMYMIKVQKTWELLYIGEVGTIFFSPFLKLAKYHVAFNNGQKIFFLSEPVSS